MDLDRLATRCLLHHGVGIDFKTKVLNLNMLAFNFMCHFSIRICFPKLSRNKLKKVGIFCKF